MKRFWALCLALVLLLSSLPTLAFGKAKQMEDGVPVWDESTVRQYMLDYIEGKSMDRLWGYYDLQIRRYMPTESYAKLLDELSFMTGQFVGLGSYRSFTEPQLELKTHVLHLCMEKQDLDVYFTHKDKEDDWEVMALEFVPAAKELPVDGDMLVVDEGESIHYQETEVTVGAAPYALGGILTMPATASADHPVMGCVLVHDFGALDRDHTVGNTKLFEDMARRFAEMGIATLRYDKRTYAYPTAPIETVMDEVVSDAVDAIRQLEENPKVSGVAVIGVGFGGMLAPRIAREADGKVKGLVLIGAKTTTVAEAMLQRDRSSVDALPEAERKEVLDIIRNIRSVKDSRASAVSFMGRNGMYFKEAAQYDTTTLLRKVALPFLCMQGVKDTETTEKAGVSSFISKVGGVPGARYETLRGLNHLLMNDLSVDANGRSTYQIEAHLDKAAARMIALWVLALDNTNATK